MPPEGKCHVLGRRLGTRALVTVLLNPLPKGSFWVNNMAML